MIFKTAGRPRTTKNPIAETKDSTPWTKEELSIIAATERQSITMLAIAVVKQWIADGKPSQDLEAIKTWLNVIKESI